MADKFLTVKVNDLSELSSLGITLKIGVYLAVALGISIFAFLVEHDRYPTWLFIVCVAIVIFCIARMFLYAEKWDRSNLFEALQGKTVAEFKASYLSIKKPSYSSRNYLMKRDMEEIILNACTHMKINESGFRMGYKGKIKTSSSFVEVNPLTNYFDARTQYLVDKFFECHEFDDQLIAELTS